MDLPTTRHWLEGASGGPEIHCWTIWYWTISLGRGRNNAFGCFPLMTPLGFNKQSQSNSHMKGIKETKYVTNQGL